MTQIISKIFDAILAKSEENEENRTMGILDISV